MNPKIVVDSREYSKTPQIYRGLEKLGAKLLIDTLQYGDYYVHGKYLVERKTSVNFAGSLKSGQIWRQLQGLKSSETTQPLLLIEGSLSLVEKFSMMNPKSLLAALISISDDWRVPVFFVPSRKWSVIFLYQLGTRCLVEGEKVHPVSFKPKAETPTEMKRRIVEALPMIGAKQALNLLTYFGTVRNIVNASAEELRRVKGIGRKKAEIIYRILNEKF